MAIGPGSRIGPYEVTALMGEGGMGKVWRARHTALNRDDALKVLPDAFSADPDRLGRFRREAQVLASLNHSNIAHVYGLEQAGDVQALVMELVDGPTLADRIADGPIPVVEALTIAKQIAEALEAAHEQGIIHRDLKPSNIKLRSDGSVKVLDFGLAKALDSTPTPSDSSRSPTITSPAMMTGVGMILGTAAYMSPEQARGKAVDKRSDIWAFGCVLYEMLTGKRCFEGDDVADTLAAVARAEPTWDLLPEDVSPSVRLFLRRCLQKNAKQRVHDIADVRLALEGAFETAAVRASQREAVVASPLWRRALPIVVAIVTVSVVTGVGVWSVTRSGPSGPLAVSRFVITPPASAPLTQIGGYDVIISPNGRRIVYVGEDPARGRMLFTRDIDALETRAMPGTEGAADPFFSPNGAWIGFERGTTLVKVATSGGPPLEIVNAGGGITGSTWGVDDTVIFAKDDGLYRVSAGGGSVQRLTEAGADKGYIAPHLLPGGKAVVFYLRKGDWASDRLAVLSLETGERKVLMGGGAPLYASSGHLVFARGTTLMAAPFDVERLEVTGDPVALVENVRRTGASAAQYWLSENGTLVYRPAIGAAGGRTLVWAGRGRGEEALTMEPRDYANPSVSPDGGRVAVWAGQDIWIYDLARSTTTRLTFDPGLDFFPLWTLDGERVVFASNRAGNFDLYWRRADGTGPEERLTTGPQHEFPQSWANGGRDLVFTECRTPDGPCDLSVLSLAGERQAKALLQTEFNEDFATVSPDGRWLAYDSNESGQPEIFVRPFPDVESGRWQVSTSGGTEPLWGPKGDELFYRTPTSLMVVPIRTGSTPMFGNAAALLNLGRYAALFGRDYDVAPKGDRFILAAPIAPGGVAADQIVVVQGWFEELKRRVPTK